MSHIFSSRNRFRKKKNHPIRDSEAWPLLRRYGFHQQQLIGGATADFIHLGRRIVVQNTSPLKEDDKLRNQGYLVFRFRSNELAYLETVVFGNNRLITEFEKSLAQHGIKRETAEDGTRRYLPPRDAAIGFTSIERLDHPNPERRLSAPPKTGGPGR